MAQVNAGDRLPDVPLRLEAGAEPGLHAFLGQKLVLFFCPEGREAAADEIESYRRLADSFERAGTWVVGMVGSSEESPPLASGPHLRIGIDEDGRAFRELIDGLRDQPKPRREDGMVFIIERDGRLRHGWTGAGHARQALENVRERP